MASNQANGVEPMANEQSNTKSGNLVTRSLDDVAVAALADLRRPRRTGADYDYMDANIVSDNPKGVYHTPTSRGNAARFDYMDQDQNRLHKHQPPPPTSMNHAVATKVPHKGDPYDADEGNMPDDEWTKEHLARLRALRHRLEAQLAAAPAAAPPRKAANPGPVGLLGFGMTTVLLNLHNTGHWPLYTVVPAMGICFGGGAQFIAGLLEFTRGNTFAYVAFVAYGAFWLSLVCVWMLPGRAIGMAPDSIATPEYYLGVYLFIWGIFSFVMLMCTLRLNLALFLVFLTVTLLFLLLGCGHMAGNPTAIKVAGYEGIICGSLALYLAFAEILNEVWDRTILPIVPMTEVVSWWERMRGKNKPEHLEA